METLPEIQSIRSDLSDRTLTLNLTLKTAEEVSVRSCEVIGRNFRNRVSFQETSELGDILVHRLSDAIKSSLKTLSAGAQVLSLPDFLIELPGLALAGAHVMVMEAKDGVRNAIFRFTEFMGTINNAFKLDIGFSEPYATHSEKLAVNILEEICLPILNLCRAFDMLNTTQDRAFAKAISDKAIEFEFQTELLKRFISNASVDRDNALRDRAYLSDMDQGWMIR
ncbi:hypothetical protein [Roseobacter litoralis]|uniref:hypothetical protein n=1 Tax=Roseobacter litoralis TaxID=42443 RepID=UPI002493E67E|nr:hypothetical protein [Roseobacter litoralis]